MTLDERLDPVVVDAARPERIDAEADRVGDADAVGDLDLEPVGQTCRDDVLGDPAGGIGGERSTLVGSLPEKAPPPWRAIPP